MAMVDLEGARLVTAYQVHSPDVVEVRRPWAREDAPKADAMVTRERGLALGILTADCVPVLFAEAGAGVVGAAHAGWKGALTGVIEATIAAMATLGARSEEHTSELQSLMRISYAVFCLKKKNNKDRKN